MNATIKILIIIDNLRRGGKERRLVELLKGLKENPEIEIYVILLKELNHYPEINDLQNVRVKVLERKIKKDPLIFIRIFRICKQYQPAIIHSWGSMPSIYAVPAAKLLRVKFINAMISNAIFKPASKNWIRAKLTFPFSDVILSNSHAGLKAYHAPVHKSRVIHNGFNFSRVSKLTQPEEVRKSLQIETRYVIGMIGAFHDRKDYDTYIMAALKILGKRKDVTFVAVGDGPNIEYHKKLAGQNYPGRIKFPGQHDHVESIINIIDVGVLTTNDEIHKEGISNAILEYMALGKPVIATAGGGTNEIMIDGNTGFIINPGSQDQLIEKIEFLLDHPEDALLFGQRGKKRIQNEFSIEKMVHSTVELYKKLLDQ